MDAELKRFANQYNVSDIQKLEEALDYYKKMVGGQIETWCYQFAKKPAEEK
jgi:hypothetical protein